MSYSNSQSQLGDNDNWLVGDVVLPRTEGNDWLVDDLTPPNPQNDGAPSLPGIVLRARVKRGAIIAAMFVLILLACTQGRNFLAFKLPHATTASHSAITPVPTRKKPTASATPAPQGAPPNNTAIPGAPPNSTAVPGDGGAGADTPTAVANTATPVPFGAPPPTATDTPQPRPTATPIPTAIPPTPLRVNLIINPGFEGSGGWSFSAHSFNELGGHNSRMRHAHWDPSAAYSAFTTQTVANLTKGVYQASAWVETSCGVAGYAFTIIDHINHSQLASYTIPACQANWVQITIQATISHGSADISFTSNIGAADWLRMDDVTFMRLT